MLDMNLEARGVGLGALNRMLDSDEWKACLPHNRKAHPSRGIEKLVTYNSQGPEQREFREKVVKLIITSGVLFGICEVSEFRELCIYLESRWGSLSRKSVRLGIDAEYSRMRKVEKKFWARVDTLAAFTTDLWKSNDVNFIGFTMHWIDRSVSSDSELGGCKKRINGQSRSGEPW